MPDPRFDQAAAIEEDCTEKIALTRRVLTLFTNPEMLKLLPALEAVNDRLHRYAGIKQGKGWKQPVQLHVNHARDHQLTAAFTSSKPTFRSNITAAALRLLMALARYIEVSDQGPDDKLSYLRDRV